MFSLTQRAANQVAKLIAKERYDDATALLHGGAGVNGLCKHRQWSKKLSTLALAVIAGKPELVGLLLEKGADANLKDENGNTALYYLYMCKTDDQDVLSGIVTRLLRAGADIDAHGSGSPLLGSCYHDHDNAADAATLVLLRHGAAVTVRSKNRNESPLYRSLCCYRPRKDVIEALVSAGCPVNDKNSHGETALHKAAENGVSANIKTLLDAGADPHARDNALRTPADMARNPGVASFLNQYGSSRNKNAMPAAGWVKVAHDEVALISDKSAIGYQLTELFNFARAEVTLITRNLSSGAESVTVRAFNQLADDAPVRAAKECLHALGGTALPVKGKIVRLIERKPGNGAF